MKQKIIIFGLGGGSRDVLGLIKDINKKDPIWEVIGFVGKNNEKKEKFIEDFPVLDFSKLPKSNNYYAITSVTDPIIKKEIIKNEINRKGYRLASLVHPQCYFSDDFSIEPGSVIFPGVRVSYNVTIGKCTWLDFNCNIGHNVKIGDYSSILPSSVVLGPIGKNCLLGAGTIVHPKAKVGDDSLVGMGTNVIKPIPRQSKIINYQRSVLSNK